MPALRPGAIAASVLALLASAGAAAPAKPKGLSATEIAAECRTILASPALKRARVSVAVADLAEGNWLVEHGPDLLCTVASNNKLVTTAAALDELGPDFQFRTTVSAVGKVSSTGVLHGELLIVGRGDPNISGRVHGGKVTAVPEQWAAAVAKAGIKQITGGVIADDTYFDRVFTHPQWPNGQHSAWYCAQVGALSFNDNCVLLVVTPGARRHAPAVCSLVPATQYVTIAGSVDTSRARLGAHAVAANRAVGRNQVTVSGSVRQQSAPYTTWITVHDPALYTATVFREVLEAKGIRVGGPARLRTPTTHIDPRTVAELITTTSTLGDAVAVANARSQNFYAEQILKTLGREKRGKGTWAAGAEAVEAFLRRAHVKGVVQYTDGSGLARANRFSARQLCVLLAHAHSQKYGSRYLRSLAEPGKPGTLEHRPRLVPLQGRLFAKTGYIRGVCTLSGYLATHGGRLVAFAFLVNDYRTSLDAVRAVQDALCLKLVHYAP